MGTSMKAYIEFDCSAVAPPFTDAMQILSLTEGAFSLSRDYLVFDALAGGRQARMAPEDQNPDNTPKYAPKGMPVPQSIEVAQDFFRLVANPEHPPNHYFWPAHRCISTAEAREWMRESECFQSTVIQTVNCLGFDPCHYMADDDLAPVIVEHGQIRWHVVAEREFYNPTWLCLEDLDDSLAHRGLELGSIPVEYLILRNSMATLVEKYSRERVRLVIWFS